MDDTRSLHIRRSREHPAAATSTNQRRLDAYKIVGAYPLTEDIAERNSRKKIVEATSEMVHTEGMVTTGGVLSPVTLAMDQRLDANYTRSGLERLEIVKTIPETYMRVPNYALGSEDDPFRTRPFNFRDIDALGAVHVRRLPDGRFVSMSRWDEIVRNAVLERRMIPHDEGCRLLAHRDEEIVSAPEYPLEKGPETDQGPNSLAEPWKPVHTRTRTPRKLDIHKRMHVEAQRGDEIGILEETLNNPRRTEGRRKRSRDPQVNFSSTMPRKMMKKIIVKQTAKVENGAIRVRTSISKRLPNSPGEQSANWNASGGIEDTEEMLLSEPEDGDKLHAQTLRSAKRRRVVLEDDEED